MPEQQFSNHESTSEQHEPGVILDDALLEAVAQIVLEGLERESGNQQTAA